MSFSLPKNLRRSQLAALLIATSLGFGATLVHADSIYNIQKLMKAGQYPQALEKTDAYLASKPKDTQGRFTKGLILTEMNRPAEAIAVFTKMTEDYPELPEPYNNLAVLYAQQRQFDKARTALEMAIRTHPAYATAYENLGDVYSKMASQAYDKALQIDSSNSTAQGKLSLIRDLVSTAPRTGVKPASAARVAEPVKTSETAKTAPAITSATATTSAAPATTAVVDPAKTKIAAETTTATPAKPAEPVKPTPAAPDHEAEITHSLQAWAAAWSKKDVNSYLAHYAPDFDTPNGMPRKAWEAERRQRIDKPGKITVTVENIKVAVNGNKATVKFRQGYASSTLNSSASKVLVMVRIGSKWLIQQERVG